MKTIIFDLDNTLIDTEALKPYRSSREGRRYIINNIRNVETKLISPYFREVVNYYSNSKTDKVIIVTNSGRDIAYELLIKHQFNVEVEMECNAKKPFKSNFESKYSKTDLGDILTIGDLPTDVLFSHELSAPSVAFNYSVNNIRENLIKAEPTKIIDRPEELEEIIINFEKGKLTYIEREFPKKVKMIEQYREDIKRKIEIDFVSLGDYHPYNSDNFNNFSRMVLDFKSSKYIHQNKIKTEKIKYFYNKVLNTKGKYINLLDTLLKEVLKKIDSLGLEKEETLIIAAPNSLPEYCYMTDMNNIFIKNIGNQIKIDYPKNRGIYRVFPVKSSSSNKNVRNNIEDHINTIGIIPDELNKKYETVIIFDDVKTKGTQIKAIATILKEMDIGKKFIGLTLGETYYNQNQNLIDEEYIKIIKNIFID